MPAIGPRSLFDHTLNHRTIRVVGSIGSDYTHFVNIVNKIINRQSPNSSTAADLTGLNGGMLRAKLKVSWGRGSGG